MKRPAFWIVLVVLAIAATIVGIRYFPQAFSIVALDITMDRERALADARALMDRERLGPDGYRQAASFALDDEAQTFVELEGGGKDAFTAMLRDGLYSAYTWRVRQFKEGEVHETLVRFTPDGRPYGFRERLKEDAPGAALTPTTRGGLRKRRDGEVAGRSSTLLARRAVHRSAARAAASITPSPTSVPRRRSAKDAIACAWWFQAIG